MLERYFEVSQSDSVGALRARLVDFAHDMDFGLVSAIMVYEPREANAKALFLSVTNAPEAYLTSYSNASDSRRDPVLRRLKRVSVPFIWDQETYAQDGAADLWEEQATFGYRTGISVAIHMPGARHFLLGVDRDKRLPRQPQRLTRMMADLQLLAVHAQEAAARLLTPPAPLPLPAEPPVLNERELDILRWTMAGKSAWAVGELLSISVNTVNFHFRNIFRKLDTSSKHQAVLKAIALGLLR